MMRVICENCGAETSMPADGMPEDRMGAGLCPACLAEVGIGSDAARASHLSDETTDFRSTFTGPDLDRYEDLT
jgi:hypothetical protein